MLTITIATTICDIAISHITTINCCHMLYCQNLMLTHPFFTVHLVESVARVHDPMGHTQVGSAAALGTIHGVELSRTSWVSWMFFTTGYRLLTQSH